MIERTVESMAVFINKRNEGIVSTAVMKFALIIIFNILSVVAIVLLVGLFTNTLKESLIALTGFSLLRFFSGGLHVKSSIHCVGISVLLFVLILFIPVPLEYGKIIQITSFLLIIIFAPAHIENHIRINKRYTPFLKIISIIIVGTNFYLSSIILAKCFFLQGLSLIEFNRK